MKTAALMLVSLIVGGLFPIQGALNSHLNRFLNHPLQASFISFAGAIILLVILLLIFHPALPDTGKLFELDWYYFMGGACGVGFVTMFIILAPKIGIANTTAAFIAGQLMASVFLDHFGAIGLPVNPISMHRVIGCLLLIGGLLMIQRT